MKDFLLLATTTMMMAASLSRFGIVRAFSPVSSSLRVRHVAVVSGSNKIDNSCSRLYMSAAATEETKNDLVPMTLLSGFLGSGKTTTLKHLLENTEGVKVGVIVNDVASVNIDAKLISSSSSVDDTNMVQLDNGCACCSLADELLTTVEKLLMASPSESSDGKPRFDALVVELSGVADPLAIKSNWQMATQQGHPVTKLTEVSRVVTLVDACTFGSDWMTADLAESRESWTETGDECSGQRKVTELLAEQVECADVIILNKIDMATADERRIASGVASGINDKAYLQSVEFGKIDTQLILGAIPEKKETKKKEEAKVDCKEPGCTDETHSHSKVETDCSEPGCTDETHNHSKAETDCKDPGCTDETHNHSKAETDCKDPGCTDETHNHSKVETDCGDPGCTDETHNHSKADTDCSDPGCTDETHNHSKADTDCSDPGCTDETHNHSKVETDCGDPGCTDETHNHSKAETSSHSHDTDTDALGITNFVYNRTRPFNTQRLLALLNIWPIPIKNNLEISEFQKEELTPTDYDNGDDSPFIGVLRSKGFCWMAPNKWMGANDDAYRHDTAMYWSHAGKHLGITSAGKWWGSIEKEDMKRVYFKDNLKEYERIITQDFVSKEWKDRRQELVFIGTGISETRINEALDDCLLSDVEMEYYRKDLTEHNFITTDVPN